jgi:2-methylisocitrate lyase-like PEP mutase family enzyme
MIQKIKAAVDARKDEDLQIIARTDARAVEDLDRAIERAQRFVEAGADLTFVEAPLSIAELERIAKEIQAPQVANIVHGGRTPDPGRVAFARMGFSIVLYANAGLQAALRACAQVFSSLKANGSLENVSTLLATFEERQQSVAKDVWDSLEHKYRI